MATGPCEVLERNEECPDTIKGLSIQKESTHQQLKEDRKEDAKTPTNKEEVNGTPNVSDTSCLPVQTTGIEKEGGNKLHVIDKDLDEFVDSMTEVTPQELLEAEKPLSPEEVPEKLPRAEQVAEKVLRAEKAAERVPRLEEWPGTEREAEKPTHVEKGAEKPPRAEKIPEKVPRTEKAVEKTPRAEKPAEKTRPAGSSAPKTVPAKRKAASSAAKDTLPWEGLTLNKCLLVASFLGLLSVGCQVVQDIFDFDEDVPVIEPGVLTPPEGSPQEGSLPGELEELWFYERWLSWPEDYEPPEEEEEEEEEEELEPEEIEEEEAEPTEIEEEEEEPTEEEEEPTEEESEPEPRKAEPLKSREKARGEAKAVKREKSFKGKALKDHKVHEEEEKEEKRPLSRHHRREGAEKERRRHQREEGKSRPPKHEAAPFKEHKRHPHDEGKGRHKEGGDRSEGRHPRRKQDSKHHPHEFKGRKPWHVQRPFFSQKDDAHKFGKHRSQEGKRHD